MRVFFSLGLKNREEGERGNGEGREREGSQQPLIFGRAERATSGLKFKRFRSLFGFALEGPLRGDKSAFRSSILIIAVGPSREEEEDVYPALPFVLAGL